MSIEDVKDKTLRLVQVNMLVPRMVKDRVDSYVANHPDEFFSSTEFWIRAVREELDHRAIEDKLL